MMVIRLIIISLTSMGLIFALLMDRQDVLAFGVFFVWFAVCMSWEALLKSANKTPPTPPGV